MMLPVVPAQLFRIAGLSLQRYSYQELRPRPQRRFNRDVAADPFNSLAHASEPVMIATLSCRDIEADTIIDQTCAAARCISR